MENKPQPVGRARCMTWAEFLGWVPCRGLAGVASYVLLLPYVLVMLRSRCYRARFDRIFRIGVTPGLPESPATEETP